MSSPSSSSTPIFLPTDIIKRNLMCSIAKRRDIFNFPSKSPVIEILAIYLASQSYGSDILAQLRLEYLAYRGIPWQEYEITHGWLRTHCDDLPFEHIISVVFETVVEGRNAIRAVLVKTVLAWCLYHRSTDFDIFLLSPEWEFFSRVYNRDSQYNQVGEYDARKQADMIREACGGLVQISDEGTAGLRITMDGDIKDWIRRYKMESIPISRVLRDISCAFRYMFHFVQAYAREKPPGPCPDDAAMDKLLRNYPGITNMASELVNALRRAHETIIVHPNCQFIIDAICRPGMSFLQCLKQVQRVVANTARLDSWSQRFPARILPLVWAASENLSAIVSFLLAGNCGLEDRGSDRLTALAAAAQNGHTGLVAYLIGKGANIEARDLAGDTPLALAAANGHIEVAKLLLSKGANLESHNFENATPLAVAGSNRCWNLAKVLISRGARVYASDIYGETYVSHMIRGNAPTWESDRDTFNRKFAATGGHWPREIPFGSKAHAAICRAACDDPNNKDHQKLYERLRSSLNFRTRSGLAENPFGYLPGQLRKQYINQKFLGHGTFSNCFSAIDRMTGKIVAIKGSRFYQCANTKRYRKEAAELQFLMHIKHENVMSLQNYIHECKYIYMVFEKADCNLREYLHRIEMSDDQIQEMTLQILTGVKYLHGKNIIHCDLKPENVLVVDGGKRFKITDLGNCEQATVDPTYLGGKKIPRCLGTQDYTPPEATRQSDLLRKGSKRALENIAGPPCDVFSVGSILCDAYAARYEWAKSREASPDGTTSPSSIAPRRISEYIPSPRFWKTITHEYAVLSKLMRTSVEYRPSVDESIAELLAIPEKIRERHIMEAKARRQVPEKIISEFQKTIEKFITEALDNAARKDGELSKRARKEQRRQKMMQGKKTNKAKKSKRQ